MSQGDPAGLCPEAKRFLERLEDFGSGKCLTKRQRERIRAYILVAAPNRDARYYQMCDEAIEFLFRMYCVIEDRAEYVKGRTPVIDEICSKEGPPSRFVYVTAVEPRRAPTPEELRAQMEAAAREADSEPPSDELEALMESLLEPD